MAAALPDTPAMPNQAGATKLLSNIEKWAQELGFSQVGISDVDLEKHEKHLQKWLAQGFHGSMDYMYKHGYKRSRPALLIPGTLRVICVRMDYLSNAEAPLKILQNPHKAYIARYALGRDYHKLMRRRLGILAARIRGETGGGQFRAFVDSAPVLERALATKAGLGWIAKNTMLINPRAGSWFFLGEIFTDLPLPIEQKEQQQHCGSCSACLVACPTQAFVAPWQLDARRCISYLTIENKGPIPESLRPLMGNRVFGCDDCQLVCPWNKFAPKVDENIFKPRHSFNTGELVELFLWREQQFKEQTAGTPIRRIGYQRWLRNLAVALGNAPSTDSIVSALKQRLNDTSPLVQEHIHWALQQQLHK